MKEVGMVASGHEVDPDRARECKSLDDRLRRLATNRAVLDAEEARALLDAERMKLHELFGFGSLLAYLEHVFGYTPRVALDRLRVARALETLPMVAAALQANEVCYTAVRELTRVATSDTETAWLDAARGKSVGVIANLVAGHKQGDRPSDPPNPTIVERPYGLDLLPEVVARLRETRADMDAEVGRRVTDSELMIALCEAWLSTAPGGGNSQDVAECANVVDERTDCPELASLDDVLSTDEIATITAALRPDEIQVALADMAERGRDRRPAIDTGRARYQIAISLCSSCGNARQDGGGISVQARQSTLARAQCDAQRIGSLDDSSPARATQDIPPATRRFIFRRDRGRCQAPGCRAHRHLEVHHVVPRAAGGSHDISNLILLCGLCRARHKPHYAAYLVMPRSACLSDEDVVLHAA